jgi:hypothetical protein
LITDHQHHLTLSSPSLHHRSSSSFSSYSALREQRKRGREE